MPIRGKSNALIGSGKIVGGNSGLYHPPIPQIGVKVNPTFMKGVKGMKFM